VLWSLGVSAPSTSSCFFILWKQLWQILLLFLFRKF
jgi:hypothetical protein